MENWALEAKNGSTRLCLFAGNLPGKSWLRQLLLPAGVSWVSFIGSWMRLLTCIGSFHASVFHWIWFMRSFLGSTSVHPKSRGCLLLGSLLSWRRVYFVRPELPRSNSMIFVHMRHALCRKCHKCSLPQERSAGLWLPFEPTLVLQNCQALRASVLLLLTCPFLNELIISSP